MDGDERRSPLQVRSVDEADKEPDLLKAQLDMLRSDIRVQQQRQETQQVAMQQLVEQIQQLSKSLSLNTYGSQQRYLLHVTPTAMFNAGIAKNLAIIVVTAQSTSHLTEPTRALETPAGCRPRARGMPKCE